MLKVLYDPFSNFYYLLVFILGAGLGAFTISRIISFLFRKDRCKTLYVLLGLVVGSLSIPLRRIYETAASFEAYNIALMVVFLLLGVFIVYFITHLEKDVDQT